MATRSGTRSARSRSGRSPRSESGRPTNARNQEGKPQQVDIGVICLNDWMPNYEEEKDRIAAFSASVLVNVDQDGKAQSYEYGYARVGPEVFILDFPLGLALQGVLPIWKRGSIAFEPLVAIDNNLPIFIVDAATRHGISGSPVVYFGRELTNTSGVAAQAPPTFPEPWLLGVYAGRRGASPEETEIAFGRVWHCRLLDEIFFERIRDGTPASTDDRNTGATPGV
ncbi:hypothetical protein [Bradyrhizobium sp.]|uniref:hypothetical protein n=1 Tax=Bradyrhizobium sp. TaxID=376 RepID=UPI002D024722|nr:hypothetical protein [Bradyrhizobium sp.]HWX64315.1 hypothetical protein [Bradyrhizobium sp.]